MPLEHHVEFEARDGLGHLNSLMPKDETEVLGLREPDVHEQLRLYPGKTFNVTNTEDSAATTNSNRSTLHSTIKAESGEYLSVAEKDETASVTTDCESHTNLPRQSDSPLSLVNSKTNDFHGPSVEGGCNTSFNKDEVNSLSTSQQNFSISDVEHKFLQSCHPSRMEFRVATLIDSATSPSPPPCLNFPDCSENCNPGDDTIRHTLINIPVDLVDSRQTKAKVWFAAESVTSSCESSIEDEGSFVAADTNVKAEEKRPNSVSLSITNIL